MCVCADIGATNEQHCRKIAFIAYKNSKSSGESGHLHSLARTFTVSLHKQYVMGNLQPKNLLMHTGTLMLHTVLEKHSTLKKLLGKVPFKSEVLKGSHGKIAQFWARYLDIIQMVLTLIRATRKTT